MVNVFLCRSERASAFAFPLGSNRLILAGLLTECLLLLGIVYTPLGNRLFATAPLAVTVWLGFLPFALGLLALEEGRKSLVRRMWFARTKPDTKKDIRT
jgi:hypothetical protein